LDKRLPFSSGVCFGKGAFVKTSLPHDAYEKIADAYAAITDTKPHNAYYERPATQSLVEDVNQRTILDIGCGTGAYSEWLVNKGATVVAVDANEKMLSHARNRLGDRATYHLANMEEPLCFLEADAFDGILCALAITYVRDHKALFAEFGRVLRDKGWLIFSTEHPFFSYRYFNIENYFTTREVSCEWTGFGEKVSMKSYYHSLGEICEALSDNGFIMERVLEPKPTKEFEKINPEDYRELLQFPLFICIKARIIK
jgi:ubiquinone/menaquinone biosynthesis C-methylase UbiE